jgi:hypothetical protein
VCVCVLRRSVAVESTAKRGRGKDETDASERDVQIDELRVQRTCPAQVAFKERSWLLS